MTATYNRKGAHTTHSLNFHLVWITKYRHPALIGNIQIRARELIRQTCESNEINIIRGAVSKDHIHLFVSIPPKLSISEAMRLIKGRSGKKLLEEYPDVKKKYFWGGNF